MSITGRIRKSPIIVTTLLLFFVASYLLPYLSDIKSQFFSSNQGNTVGRIGTTYIKYHPDYRREYEDGLREEVQRRGQFYKGIEANVHQHVWEKLILKHAFTPACDAVGIAVTGEECHDMTLGNDVPEKIKSIPRFQNPETKDFDKKKYIIFWKNFINNPGGHEAARAFEDDLRTQREQEKFSMLIRDTTTHPNTLKKQAKKVKKTIAVRILCIPYTSIADSKVRNDITEKDKKDYYQKHKNNYQVKQEESSRTIEFVEIHIIPSQKDVQRAQQELTNLKVRFLDVKPNKAESFAKQHTDNSKEIIVEWSKENLPPYLRKALKKMKKDPSYQVIGPIQQGDKVIIYRYIGQAKNNSWSLRNKEPVYRFLKIERAADSSEISKNNAFTEATNLVRKVKKTKAWKKVTQEGYGLKIHEAEITRAQATKIGQGPYRGLIRWVWDAKKLDELSGPIEIEGMGYVVAKLKKITKQGTRPFKEVEKEIETKLFNQEKAKKIKAKLHTIMDKEQSIDDIRKAYGAQAFSFENKKLHWEDNQIAPGYKASRAIGAAYALNVREKVVVNEKKHIIIIERLPDSEAENDSEVQAEKVSLNQKNEQKEEEAIIEFILYNPKTKDQNIEDNRFHYYN